MPALPAYFHRLGDSIPVFRQLKSEWVDRRTVEETLGVSKTVAWRILRRCGASDGPGNTIVCRRDELIAALEHMAATGECQREIRRRNRVEEYLGRLAQIRHSHVVQVATDERAAEVVSARLKSLPAGVQLSPSRLVIEFQGTADFLEKVGALVYALHNDLEKIHKVIESDPRRNPRVPG